MEDSKSKTTPTRDHKIKVTLKITLVVLGILFFLFLFFQQWFLGVNPKLFDQIVEHYAVFLALPCAGFASLLLVVVFDQAYGDIKISILELKFEGAAGPLILWILCYLTIVLSIHMLW